MWDEVEIIMKKPLNIWFKLMELGQKIGCHQMPDRSFFYKGYQFPVCARCTGVLIGEVVALILILCSIKVGFIGSIVFLIPMGIDWGLQYLKILESDNIRRLITGTLGGIGLSYVYYNLAMVIIMLII